MFNMVIDKCIESVVDNFIVKTSPPYSTNHMYMMVVCMPMLETYPKLIVESGYHPNYNKSYGFMTIVAWYIEIVV